MNDTPAIAPESQPLPDWWRAMTEFSPLVLALIAAPVAIAIGLLAPDIGMMMLFAYLGLVGGVVSVLRPGIGLFLFTVMLYARGSEVLTTSFGVPSIAPLFTIWLLTGVVMHYGIGGILNARPTGWQALVIYGLVLLASTLVAENTWVAMDRVIDYVRELIYIGLIIVCARQLSDLRIITRALIVGGTVPALLTIYQGLTGSTNWFFGFARYSAQIVVPGEIVEVPRPAGMVGDPNMYAMALLALVPLAFHHARWEKHLLARQLMLLAGIALSLASIMTYSRGGYVTLFAVIVCLTITGFIKARNLVIVGVVLLLLLPVMPGSYTNRLTSLLAIPGSMLSQEPPERGTARDTSVSGRMSELMAGVHMFLDHPLLGVGTNNYQVHYQEYARPMGVNRRTDRAAHSWYVEIAAETGLIGLAAFTGMVVTLFTSLQRVRRTNNRGNELYDLSLVLTISLISLLVSSIFLHFAYPRFFMVFAGLTIAVASVQNWRLAPRSRLRFPRLRATKPLLTPVQHSRMLVWGGAAGMLTIILASSLALLLLVNPASLPLSQQPAQAAIRPLPTVTPATGGSAVVDQTPVASATAQPTATLTPTIVPTPGVEINVQAELLMQAMTPAARQAECLFDVDTRHNICDAFRAFYVGNGSEAVFGQPLSEGYIVGGLLVQYFEYARFEWHAATAGQAGFILLSRLGAEQRLASVGREIDPPSVPLDDDGCIFEDLTQHNICDRFAMHWVANGGTQIFGLPITEAFNADGIRTQYFERARFELRRQADGSLELHVAPLGLEDIQRILGASLNEDGTVSGG